MSPTVRPRADAPRKILLLRLRRLGDVILTTPSITLLKESFPDASLTYLVEEPFRRLVEGNPHLDRVLTVPVKQNTTGLLRLIRSIRRERYDVLLDLHGGPRASWITLLGGAKLKVGYAIKTKGFLYDIRVPRSGASGPIHSVENHANLVKALLALARDPQSRASAGPTTFGQTPSALPPLFIPEPTDAEKARVAALLAEGPSAAPALVVLHVGAGNRFRDWGADNLAALAGLLVRDANARVAIIGAEGDRAVEERVRAAAPGAILSLCGRLNLMETRELIRRARLFAGPDSGPMHIAASTPTPIVAWFGPTLPANFAPWRPDGGGGRGPGVCPGIDSRRTQPHNFGAGECRTVILERSLACRPCPQRSCVTNDLRCLRDLSPVEVFEACRPFLL